MNRRRFLVALAVALPVAIFAVARTTASWRPVPVGRLLGGNGNWHYPEIQFVGNQVVERGSGTAFDMTTGVRTHAPRFNIVGQRAWTWQTVGGAKPQLILRDGDGAPAEYPLKLSQRIGNRPIGIVRLTPARNRVEAIVNYHYHRWNARTHALEHTQKLMGALEGAQTFGRDGDSIVRAGFASIDHTFTDGKRAPKRVKLRGFNAFEAMRISPLGNFALYDAPGKNGPSHMRVVDAQSGRVRWEFELDDFKDKPAFAPDDSALAILHGKRWEIRDAQTGRILRKLPRVIHAREAAFSPDGAMLYSVADGVLYRQRAR